MVNRKIIVEIIAMLFIILWIPAAMSKIMDVETFRFQLGRSPYIQDIAGLVAVALPVGEILIALLLLFKATRLLGLYASFLLIVLFTGYIYAMLHFSYYTPCSCGGIISLFGLEDDWNNHLKFNIAFTLLAIIGILIYPIQSYQGIDQSYQLKTGMS